MSNSPCSGCRLHSFTTSKVQENRHHATQLLETWLLCNLCIPVACDKLCQHITLVRHFSCIIHPGAYIPHGHFQIPLKLIPLFVINSLARFSCVAALWLSVSSVSEGVTCPKHFCCTVPRRPRDLHLIIHRAENKASWVVWCVFFVHSRKNSRTVKHVLHCTHTHKHTQWQSDLHCLQLNKKIKPWGEKAKHTCTCTTPASNIRLLCILWLFLVLIDQLLIWNNNIKMSIHVS